MKHLIYFLFFSTAVFSQDYTYALEVPVNTPPPTEVKNQQEEIDYFNAHLLPVVNKATLQEALDKYGSVRLEKGDYTGVDIIMRSNQRLYGHSTLNPISNITIAAGSTNVVLQDLLPNGKSVTFQAGGVISNCTLKTIKWATIRATNAQIENNLFINVMSSIHFDCSASGYFRNNKIIKHQVHGNSNMLIMKGNSTTPSYGNVHLHSNFLTPGGDTTEIDNLKTITFVGLDSEAWNYSGTGTKPMLVAKNMGDVKITDFGGANGYSTVKTPTFDIASNNLLFMNKYIQNQGENGPPKITAKTNVLYYGGKHDDYIRDTGSTVGFDVKAHFQGTGFDKDITLNGKAQSSLIPDPSAISREILGTQFTPWAKPTWETLPDPLGPNWKTDRNGKTDQTAYIQNLIDTKGIANLPEGVFYIGSTLRMLVNGTKGIIGSGTGKTVLVGLTDDFPLITLVESTSGENHFVISNITLQGGSVGVYAPDAIDMIAFTNLKYVVFRNQNYAIHLYRIFGLDNCFFDSVSFVDCNVGFFQDPNPVYTFEDAGYVDKVVFYNGQYINCGDAFIMNATRANNLDAWVNCKFDKNFKAITAWGHNFAIAANCDFVNTVGRPASGSWENNTYKENSVIDGDMALYSCNIKNSTTAYLFNSRTIYMEGCTMSDNITAFSAKLHHYQDHFIVNSTLTGPLGGGDIDNSGVFVNSKLLSNSALSKLLVNLKANVTQVLIDQASKPYPQLLVTQ